MGRHLGSLLLRIDGRCLAVDDVVVDAVLDVGGPVRHAEDPLRIGFVLREQQGHVAFAIQVALAQVGIDRLHDALPRRAVGLKEGRSVGTGMPGPLVAEPERRQNVQFGRFRTAIVNRDLNQNVFRRTFGVLDEYVEVAILIEHARIDQLVLHFLPATAAAGLDEIGVGERRLRILVKVLHVRMRRSAVEIEVVLLDILAVIALAVGQSEQAFLEDRVLAVPQGHGKAETLLVVGNPGQPVFAPAVGARSGLIVREVVPGVAALAVIFADGSPLPFAQIGPPFFPGSLLLLRFLESNLFVGHDAPLGC